jgi:hypothetical protein
MTSVIPRTQYGRCAVCGELKRLHDDGRVWVHNRYGVLRTTVLITTRCPGSETSAVPTEGTS